MRMRGMYPSDLAGYEAHRLRKNGDLNHVDRDRSDPDRNLLIGDKDWARTTLDRIAEMTLENHVAEIESLKARGRKKDVQRRILEGPKQPWRPTKHGPLREVILTANKAWFDDEMAKFLGENREADFEACALKWLRDTFGDDVVHARCDRDETAYHIHAVVVPETTVEMTRTDRKTGESRVIATRRMLQPSKHDVIENYELGQDSVGEAFSHLMLKRGERRAAAIRAARAAGEPLPKRRYHARTAQWRAEQELAIARREKAVDDRETSVGAREAEAEAVLTAAEMIGSGEIEIDESGEAPDLRPASKEIEPEAEPGQGAEPRLPPALEAAPATRKKVAGLFAPMLARLRRSAQAEAEEKLVREVAELRSAWGTIDAILSRLPASLRESLGDARKSVVRSLTALRRYGGTEPGEKSSKKSPDSR